ncbi:MAG: beta-lactamase family protein, partial [Candidatus Heimdallarchaeota archaeon]|nr:beta-lactamase family protein [Candidatus Heimdallarchaeota archaeon]
MNESDKSSPELKLTEVELPLKIESSIKEVVNHDLFSGVIVVAKADKIVYQSNHGFANIPLKVPNDLDTKFNLGSMNKMFTSIAVAKLVLEEKLSFENTLSDVLPVAKIDQSDKITVHHLLTHSSGLGSFFTPEYMKNKDKYLEIGDLLPIIAKEKLAFSPGKRFKYSNSGFEVLGMIIEQLSGMSYFDFVKKNVFLPAGMKSTDSYRKDEQTPNMSEGYTRMSRKGPDVKEELHSNKQMMRIRGSAAGGGHSTAKDLLLFSKAIFSYKLLPEELTKKVLKG